MPLLFTLAILLSAVLLFLVEPLFARLALPRLGGSPAVWNTAMLFYQVALLVGYVYAHYVATRLNPRRQAALHAVLLLVPFLVLPLSIPAGWAPPVEQDPRFWLLGLMLVRVGPPFIVLSATSPLLQRWFAGAQRAGRDPYFLYAASNAGSLLGLLSYPFLIEPLLSLGAQSALWRVGYGALVLLLLGCAAVAWRSGRRQEDRSGARAPAGPGDHPSNRQRALWLFRAFVPSSLMLSVTTYLSTNLTPFPLLWVLPLALYLLTFIIAFAVRLRPLLRLLPIAVALTLLPLAALMAGVLPAPLWVMVSWHLLTFFVAALACHCALAADRPAPVHLTEFYLWLSIGGALGGVFNALLAPLLFTAIEEYPIGLALACLAMPALNVGVRRAYHARWLDVGGPLLLSGLAVGLAELASSLTLPATWMGPALQFGLPVLVCLLFLPRPLRFGLGVAALLAVSIWQAGLWDRPLYVERSFFGISRVEYSAEDNCNYMTHGDTLHGSQSLDPERRCEPLSYYFPSGPIGQVFTQWVGDRQRIAIVGLGTGTLAAYARPSQSWTFYEIDPAVARMARDGRYFSYLSDCAPQAEIVLGDARLSLARSDAQYDLIVLDAYSSDAIPVHLITREALALYLDRLAPDGLLAFHISNRYLDLEPVLSALAEDAGLAAIAQEDYTITEEEASAGKTSSHWVLLARKEEDLEPLAADTRWRPLLGRAGLRPWTDDYSSVAGVLLWR